MNSFWLNPFFRSRYLAAAVAGFLLTAAYPRFGIAGLAWVAPGLMLAVALGKSGGDRFRIGYVGALAHYLTMLYWLLLIPYRWHGIPLGPAAGWLALSGVLALFPATWVWLVGGRETGDRRQETGGGSPQSTVHSPQSTDPDTHHALRTTPASSIVSRKSQMMHPVRITSWVGRTVWAISGAAAWVAFEMIMARVLGGFPWDLLGVSQYRLTPLIQIASVTGVYGVSFLVAWFSLSLVLAGLMIIRRPTTRSVWIGEIWLPVLVVAILFNLGFRQLRQEPLPAQTLKVTLVQPSIPQNLIWDPGKDTERFIDLLRLTERALTNRTDVLIWPESAVPKLLRYDTNTFEAITGLARRHHIWMIIGSDDAEPSRKAGNPDQADFFNSSFLISPEGRIMERYIKRNLVIFGEYIPLEHWLPFLKYFTPISGGFTPGDRAVQFNLEDLDVKTSVLICFEDIFPHLGRTNVKPDTDFLVNITNDGWFDESAAQWQHATTALFRTVENGVPLIRCSNNGLTCWADAYGRLRQIFRDDRGSIYGAGFMTAEIPVLTPGERHPPTFYNQHGDWFGWACVGIAGIMLIWKIASRGRGQRGWRV